MQKLNPATTGIRIADPWVIGSKHDAVTMDWVTEDWGNGGLGIGRSGDRG